MTHSVPSTFSPSSFRITRSTPCVEGCCGPILMTISLASRKVAWGVASVVAMILLAALDVQVLTHPAHILLQDAVVLAQREALPLLGQENPRKVRVIVEADAEHVEDFAFHPVRAAPDAHDAVDGFLIRQRRLNAQALIARERI